MASLRFAKILKESGQDNLKEGCEEILYAHELCHESTAKAVEEVTIAHETAILELIFKCKETVKVGATLELVLPQLAQNHHSKSLSFLLRPEARLALLLVPFLNCCPPLSL